MPYSLAEAAHATGIAERLALAAPKPEPEPMSLWRWLRSTAG